jgi:ADP-ribose pyrophosphatase YjhB (NUDIX family)
LRAPIFRRPTPLATGDAAIIDDEGRILLILRADNGKWAMPGGAMEVGETPAEGVLREVLEETGMQCEIVALVGVHDSRRAGAVTRHHLYMMLFLCRPVPGHEQPSEPLTADEIVEMRWFSRDALPLDIDPGHITRIPQAYRVWRRDLRADYDR